MRDTGKEQGSREGEEGMQEKAKEFGGSKEEYRKSAGNERGGQEN